MSGGRAPSKNVTWTKPQEPTFLKAFKDKVGYKEPVSIDAKREAGPPPSVEDREDREDELPTVVVLKAGDVNQDEFMQYRKTTKKKGDESSGDADGTGRIVFNKPTKRKSSEGALGASTSKKAKNDEDHRKTGQKKTNSSKGVKNKGVKNKSLLSFGDDDEQ